MGRAPGPGMAEIQHRRMGTGTGTSAGRSHRRRTPTVQSSRRVRRREGVQRWTRLQSIRYNTWERLHPGRRPSPRMWRRVILRPPRRRRVAGTRAWPLGRQPHQPRTGRAGQVGGRRDTGMGPVGRLGPGMGPGGRRGLGPGTGWAMGSGTPGSRGRGRDREEEAAELDDKSKRAEDAAAEATDTALGTGARPSTGGITSSGWGTDDGPERDDKDWPEAHNSSKAASIFAFSRRESTQCCL